MCVCVCVLYIYTYTQMLLSQSHLTFGNLHKSFQLMPKGLEAKGKYCVGGTSTDFVKKWDRIFQEIESKCRDLLLEDYCKKLFCLMSSFWEAIADVDIDRVRVRTHLDKMEKEQAKT